jgi:hypothetical protein
MNKTPTIIPIIAVMIYRHRNLIDKYVKSVSLAIVSQKIFKTKRSSLITEIRSNIKIPIIKIIDRVDKIFCILLYLISNAIIINYTTNYKNFKQ